MKEMQKKSLCIALARSIIWLQGDKLSETERDNLRRFMTASEQDPKGSTCTVLNLYLINPMTNEGYRLIDESTLDEFTIDKFTRKFLVYVVDQAYRKNYGDTSLLTDDERSKVLDINHDIISIIRLQAGSANHLTQGIRSIDQLIEKYSPRDGVSCLEKLVLEQLKIRKKHLENPNQLALAKAEEKARKEAEEQARKEEEAARKEEEAARKDAEEAARKAEEAARKAAEEAARKEAEEKARKEAEEKARQEAEEQASQEAEEQARKEAEEAARKEAEEQAARKEAEEQVRQEAEQQAQREAEEAAEKQARGEAEEAARKEAQEKAREAEEAVRKDAEEQAHKDAEEKARQEAEQQAQCEAEEEKQLEENQATTKNTQATTGRQTPPNGPMVGKQVERIEAGLQARKAREQAQPKAQEQAHKESEEKTRGEAEEAARQQAEEQARGEAEEQARQAAVTKIAEKAKKLADTYKTLPDFDSFRQEYTGCLDDQSKQSCLNKYSLTNIITEATGASAGESRFDVALTEYAAKQNQEAGQNFYAYGISLEVRTRLYVYLIQHKNHTTSYKQDLKEHLSRLYAGYPDAARDTMDELIDDQIVMASEHFPKAKVKRGFFSHESFSLSSASRAISSPSNKDGPSSSDTAHAATPSKSGGSGSSSRKGPTISFTSPSGGGGWFSRMRARPSGAGAASVQTRESSTKQDSRRGASGASLNSS